jgi:hypothetical protein
VAKRKNTKTVKISKNQARALLWRRGTLRWLLREEQTEIYDIIRSAEGLKYCLYMSRRWGKSHICMLMAIEDCLRHKNWEIGFVAPTKVQIKRVYGPIMNTIFKYCPKDIRPAWKADLGGYLFPSTGSLLFMSGTDNKHWEDLLGMNLHKAYFDEPGTMSDLMQIVKRVVTPMTMTTKEERGAECGIILLGTPSATPAHDYFFLKEECKSEGNFQLRDIYDNSGLTNETITEYIKEAGGEESTTCQREYFCRDVVDTELAVIPEFNQEKEDKLVVEFERPEHFEVVGALDPGFSDYTAYVLGYYDFKNAVYRIEGELLINKSPTPVIAEEIKKLEDRLFPQNKTYVRYSDTEPQIICDLARYHELFFTPTKKDGKEARINELRMLISNERVFIHPRCKHLVRHVKTAIWNENRTKFERTASEGHFDLLDSLIYFIRNVDVYTNPYPPGHYDPREFHVNSQPSNANHKWADSLMGV